jgi:hypothetical protein
MLRNRFVFIEGRDNHEGALGIGFMDGATTVSKRVLGKPLRIATRLRALSPGMSIAMEAHAEDSGDAASPAELSGTGIWLRLLESWKEIA